MTVVRGDAARHFIARTRAKHVEHVSKQRVAAWTTSLDLPTPAVDSGQVSAFVRTQLGLRNLSERCDDTALVAHELVTNALEHGRAPVQLRVSELGDGQLLVEVSDAAPVSLELTVALHVGHAPLGTDDQGRGLEIIGLLASSWGVRVHPHGKCVWAILEQES